MKHLLLLLVPLLAAAPLPAAEPAHSPVLVELFTSEGCSSCPPADRLLEALDKEAHGDIIVLSEHVDYWNHIGWRDPYSSAAYSDRQRAYANHFRISSVYTPQMVVDGGTEFVGSDAHEAKSAIQSAARRQKVSVRLTSLGGGKVRVETDAVAAQDVDVYLAIASNDETSNVKSGENGGRRLHHVAVVRTLTKLGTVKKGETFSKELEAPATGNQRVVAFIQERGPGRVLGVAKL